MNRLLPGLCTGFLALAALAQESRPTTAPTAESFARLCQELDGGKVAVPLPLAEQERRLDAFLQAEPTERRRLSEIGLRAEARRGLVRLQLLALDRAGESFMRVLADAPATAADLRGTALYGQALVHELRDELELARDCLRRLQHDLAGTRYANLAATAWQRLAPARLPQIGAALPDLRPRLDSRGESRDLRRLAGSPALLVFVRLDEADTREHLQALATTWAKAGLRREQLLCYCLGTSTAEMPQQERELQLPATMLACPQEFLDEAALALRVTALPASFLLAADGTLLARDLPAGRLARVLSELPRR